MLWLITFMKENRRENFPSGKNFKYVLGIPLCGLLSTRALEFGLNWGRWDVSFLSEVVAQIWLGPLRGFWGCWETFIEFFFYIYINSFMPFLASEGCIWPLTASMTSEVMEADGSGQQPSAAKNSMKELIYWKKFLNNLKNPLASPIRFELQPQGIEVTASDRAKLLGAFEVGVPSSNIF